MCVVLDVYLLGAVRAKKKKEMVTTKINKDPTTVSFYALSYALKYKINQKKKNYSDPHCW